MIAILLSDRKIDFKDIENGIIQGECSQYVDVQIIVYAQTFVIKSRVSASPHFMASKNVREECISRVYQKMKFGK